MIKLSPRLQIIYDMVPACDTVADVGCDHGYLSIALLESRATKAIAMDVNKGPLESARANIAEAGLEDRVSLRLSDGLEKLEASEADVICICGMGGALIQRILGAHIETARSAKAIILEPQSEYRQLREFLTEKGFSIIDEELCTEEGKIYPIIKLVYKPDENISLNEYELEYGPVIIKKHSKLFWTLLEKNKKEYQGILDKLSRYPSTDSNSPIQKRKDELIKKLELISKLTLYLEEMYGKDNH